ncbi:MAG: exo-beta-N-acetylmuramidase NamZ domain-containing protein [Bacteroidales bacterium]
MLLKLLLISIMLIALASCSAQKNSNNQAKTIKLGNERIEEYIPLLNSKRVGIVANHTSIINNKHLVDTLTALGVNIKRIFSPEHGFRGEGDAGQHIKNQIDERTGIPVISLYGNRKKPTHDEFNNLDVIVFDMQDVGVRIYTYISTMHYVMETCAEMNLPFLILDRPNPNGFYVDGPVLDTSFRSFVGMHPVPLVHGMTMGEFAQMINGEGWLEESKECSLTVIPCLNYTHDSTYVLPVPPSPNLPNQTSVYLYPSLGFFEGSVISVGRGTNFPFQVFGHPNFHEMEFSFTPMSKPGASKNPPYKGETCHGIDLRDYNPDFFLKERRINLEWLKFAYEAYPNKEEFFNNFFNLLAGNNILKEQIKKGIDEETIRNSWNPAIQNFMKTREKYLLYPDFTE